MSSLETKVNDLNNDLKLIFPKYSKRDHIVFNNLYTILGMCKLYGSTMEDFFKGEIEKPDFTKLTKADFVEKQRIMEDFFKYIGVDFIVDVPISDGTFEMKTHTLASAVKNPNHVYRGFSGNTDGNEFIKVNNNGLLLDSIIWVHEVAHYRNSGQYESDERSMLTEAVSFAYEYIFMDYLDQLGYTLDALEFKYLDTYNLFKNACDSFDILKLYYVYSLFDDINLENYSKIFDPEYYEETIDSYFNSHKGQTTINKIRYALASTFSAYMYQEYKKDKSFIKKLELFNRAIIDEPLEDCLQIIGIINYNDEGLLDEHNIDKLREGILSLKQELLQDREILNKIKEKEDKELIID